MDFVLGLPRTRRQHDSIWVISNRMTKSTHFLLVKTIYLQENYSKLYLQEVVKTSWISRLYQFRKKCTIYCNILEVIPKGFRFKGEFKYCLSNSDICASIAHYSYLRGYVHCVHDQFQK